MEETKYGKYFKSKPLPGEKRGGFGASEHTVILTDDDVIKGSQLFWVLSMGPKYIPPSHGPHTHKDPEVLVLLGTNPDDPWDLGAEIDFYMGEEMEVHTITKSTLIYIPANFVHCPIVYKKITRPFFFVQSQYAPKLTETSYKKMVSQKEKGEMLFFNFDGKQTLEEEDKQREQSKRISEEKKLGW